MNDSSSHSPDSSDTPAEWTPKPREWTWQDIFKAPMIALKLRCMIISVATIFAMVFISKGFSLISDDIMSTVIAGPILEALQCIVLGAVFGIGGTFVAIFIKSELLDDDYPTMSEAIAQFKQRIFPAIMVPVFLLLALKAIFFGQYMWNLVCSVPYAGSILYFGSIPSFLIAFVLSIFGIGVLLSFFVFPSIVAIRKHGWFDNVIDTLEAVGTKPHKVIASIVVTLTLIALCMGIAFCALKQVKDMSNSPHLPQGGEVAQTEAAANYILSKTLPPVLSCAAQDGLGSALFTTTGSTISSPSLQAVDSFYHQWITGLATGVFQTVLIYLIAGYGFNILITGGMLSYLHVREDDYWDDEDLADLDALAKELEEEAASVQGDNTPVAADGVDDAGDTDKASQAPTETDDGESSEDKKEDVGVDSAVDDDTDNDSEKTEEEASYTDTEEKADDDTDESKNEDSESDQEKDTKEDDKDSENSKENK